VRWTAIRSEFFNAHLRQCGRQWLYDEQSLARLVVAAGLAAPRTLSTAESDNPEFQRTGQGAGELVLETAVPAPRVDQRAGHDAPRVDQRAGYDAPGNGPFWPVGRAVMHAIEAMAEALPALDPEPVDAERPRLSAAERLRRAGGSGLQQAYEDLSAAVAEHPRSDPLRLGLADVLLEAGEPAAALDLLTAGMTAPPRCAGLYLRAGIAALLLRRDVDARAAFIIAQTLAPDSDAPRRGLEAVRWFAVLRR